MPPQHRNKEEGHVEEPSRIEEPASRFGVDQMAPMEPLLRTSTIRRESFLLEFANSKGPPQIIILCMLLALGFGSTIGVVSMVL
jgi:hypothetical protein